MDDQTSEGRARIAQIRKRLDDDYILTQREDAEWLLSLVATLQQQPQAMDLDLAANIRRQTELEQQLAEAQQANTDWLRDIEQEIAERKRIEAQLQAQTEALETLRAKADELAGIAKRSPGWAGISKLAEDLAAALATVGEPPKDTL